MSKTFYKTKVVIEVLHEGPIEFDSLHELHNMIGSGDCSGDYVVHSAKKLSSKQMAKECIKQGSDPEFFGINEEGEEV